MRARIFVSAALPALLAFACGEPKRSASPPIPDAGGALAPDAEVEDAPDSGAPTCPTGRHLCSGACVANESVDHCGSECGPCFIPPKAYSDCDGLRCGFHCFATACLNEAGNACVANDTIAACGTDCAACSAPEHATPDCTNGQCAWTCDHGFRPDENGGCIDDGANLAWTDLHLVSPDSADGGFGVWAAGSARFLVLATVPQSTRATLWALTTGSTPPAWVEVATSTDGLEVLAANMVYDEANNRMIFLGGGDCAPERYETIVLLDHADGTQGDPEWIALPAAPGETPHCRSGTAVGYNPSSNRAIMFGAEAIDLPPSVWILENANGLDGPTAAWSNVETSGGGPSNFRFGEAYFYDPATDRLVVFGGRDGFFSTYPLLSEVWALEDASALNGTPTWFEIYPQGALGGDWGYGTAAYDSANNRMILFGGAREVPSYEYFNEIFILTDANGDGTPRWETPDIAAPLPMARFNGAGVYDPAMNRLYVGAGDGEHIQMPIVDTWVLDGANGL